MIGHIERNRTAIATRIAPRIFLDSQEVPSNIVIHDCVILKVDLCGSICYIEIIAFIGRDSRIFSSKDGLTGRCVATHGLIKKDVFVSSRLTIKRIVCIGQIDIFECDAIFALDNCAFGCGGY